mgnify:FL=1
MFSITPIVSSNYSASWGELVRLDMSGKLAPDVVAIQLPAAAPANTGQVLAICTTNPGGAEDGSAVRIVPAQGQTIAGSKDWAPQQGERFYLFVSDGSAVRIVSGA